VDDEETGVSANRQSMRPAAKRPVKTSARLKPGAGSNPVPTLLEQFDTLPNFAASTFFALDRQLLRGKAVR
jgi:hypothetical protein